MVNTYNGSWVARSLSADVSSRTQLGFAAYGLGVIRLLIGGLTFTHAEAIANAPFGVASFDKTSRAIGSSEIVIALHAATRECRPFAATQPASAA